MRRITRERQNRNPAEIAIRFVGLAALTFTLCIPLWVEGAAPGWWATRGVISTAPANDYAVVNQGQLKNLAKAAAAEMDAHLPGGAGTAIHQLLTTWETPTATTNDFQALNLGQLKNLAKPFYDQFIGIGYTDRYPWTDPQTPANDFALANIGQAKNLFAFEPSEPGAGLDLDHNGLPDWWEIKYFSRTGTVPAEDTDGDGLTNLQEYAYHTDPQDYSNSEMGPDGDRDNNGLGDWWEMLHFGHLGNDPSQTVSAKGGLTLKQIFDNQLDLIAVSSVGDGIPDSWKIAYGLSVSDLQVMNEDPDSDGLPNADEYQAGADPMNWDSDGDGIADGQDLAPLVVNPLDPTRVAVTVPSWEAQAQLPSPDYSVVDYTAIAIKWQPPNSNASAVKYRVEKRIDSNPWVDVATVASGVTSQTDQGLVANRHYRYRVTALTDSGTTHIESAGVAVDYEVPLGLRVDVKQASIRRNKSAWSWPEFTTPTLPPSTPANFYLVDTSTSSHDQGDGNSAGSSTGAGDYSYTKTSQPSSHTRKYHGEFNNSHSSNGHDDRGSFSDHWEMHSMDDWQDKSRGKQEAAAESHGNAWMTYSDHATSPGPDEFWKTDWDGAYLLQTRFIPASGSPVWKGDDFDLTLGSLSRSGNSAYHLNDHPSDGSSYKALR